MAETSTRAAAAAVSSVGDARRSSGAKKKKKTAAAPAADGGVTPKQRRSFRYTSLLQQEAAGTEAAAGVGVETAARGERREEEKSQRVLRETYSKRNKRTEEEKKKEKQRGIAVRGSEEVDMGVVEKTKALECFLFGRSSTGREETLSPQQHLQLRTPQLLQQDVDSQQQLKKKKKTEKTGGAAAAAAATRLRHAAAAAAGAVSQAAPVAAAASSSAIAAAQSATAAADWQDQQQQAGSSSSSLGSLRKKRRQREAEQQQQQAGGREEEQQQEESSRDEKEEAQQGNPSLMRVVRVPSGSSSVSSSAQKNHVSADAAAAAAEAAWIDTDDLLLHVDIAGKEKLRKLRQHTEETAIGGVEYAKRLKQLHAKLEDSRSSSSWIERARRRKQQHQQQLLLSSAHAPEASSEEEEEELEASTGQAWAAISSSSAVLSGAAAQRQQRRMQQQQQQQMSSSSRRETLGMLLQEEALPSGKVNLKRLVDANVKEISGCAVSALEFHPQQPLLLTAGRDKALRLFSIDGEENTKLETLFFRNFPLLQAQFAAEDGSHILAVSHASPSLADYDINTGQVHMLPALATQAGQKLVPCGFHFLKVGSETAGQPSLALGSAASQNVLLCDAHSKRLLRVLAMNGKTAGIAYHPTKPSIFTADRDANIYEWDLRAESCVSIFQDTSCLRLSSLSASPPPTAGCSAPPPLLATGSRTGYVDLFGLPSNASSGEKSVRRSPLKELGNLTTEITTMVFHPSNQLLCVASKWKKDALRLIHLPSMTVFQNWPVERTPLRYVTAAAFSRQRGFMAIGNDRGRVLLYKLNHFNG